MTDLRPSHVSAEHLQAFLEHELPSDERARLEGHFAACARCSAELDAWRVLFTDLEGLGSAAPRAGFADRVMAAVEVPARISLAARVRSWMAPSRATAHVDGYLLQDLADGLLPARRVARVRAHVDTCAPCANELDTWRRVLAALGGLERFAPREGFAARVMSAVRQRAAAPVDVVAPRPVAPWDRALAAARRIVPRLVPQTRRAWAALTGVAVTPAAIFGLVLYVVFSHPTLTPQALASFALWQAGDFLALAWNAVMGAGLETASALGAGSVMDLLTQSPLVVAGGALAYCISALVALRVLYKNLMTNRRYATR